MKTILKLFLCGALLLSFENVRAASLGYAQESGGKPGTFLDFAASARSVAMGRAHTGVADDASAVYWNPAGLTQIDRQEIVSFYSALYEDTKFGSASYALPTPNRGTFGLGFVSLRTDNITKRDSGANNLGTFQDSQMALLLSHGWNLNSRWAFGSTAKWVRQSIDVYSANGYGLDAGAMYRASQNVQLGMSMKNLLAPELRLHQDSETFGREARLGFKVTPSEKWVTALDLVKTQYAPMKFSLGGEFRASQLIRLRGGLEGNELSAGIGLSYANWGMDYAMGYHDATGGPADLGVSHRFGFHARFGRGISEQAELARLGERGRNIVAQLETAMRENHPLLESEITALTKELSVIIRRNGISKSGDMFAAQAYLAFFQGNYDKSVQFFDEAIALNTARASLQSNREKALAAQRKTKTDEMVAQQVKTMNEALAAGELRRAAEAARHAQKLQPDNNEINAVIKELEDKIQKPIAATLDEAVALYEKGDYLESLRAFTKLKEMDPENKDASFYIPQAIGALEKQASAQTAQTTKRRPVYQVERNVKKGMTLYSQGLLVYSQGKIKEAGELWSQALALDPYNDLARNAYSRVQREVSLR